jgi:hypothetical protein
MKFTTRIWVIVVTSMLGLLVMGSLGLHSMRESMLEDRKKEITQLLNFADAQLKYFQQQEKMGFLSRIEAQAKAKEAIGAMRSGNDYFTVRALSDGMTLVHPIESRIGKIDDDIRMKDGRTLVQTYKDGLANSDKDMAFVWVAVPNPEKVGDKTLYPKLNGLKKFDQWDWYLGIGFFVDDINEFFWKQATIFLAVGAVLLAALGWLVIGMRNAILSQLGGEPEVASESMRRIANGDLAVDIPLQENDNESLMAALKLMQLKLNNISSAIQENTHSLNDQVRSFDLMARNYQQTKSEEQFNYLLAAVKKIGRTVDILGKSTARIKL